jgi:DNA adenine methylase
MTIPHPIPYQGSKRRLADKILAYLPAAQRLFEPFCGSAAISLASAYHHRADTFFLNDINQPLADLWRQIIQQPERLIAQYSELWYAQLGREKEYYYTIRDRFNQTHQAHDFLYLLARCVKASVRYNSNGEFNQSPDNRRKGMRPETLARHINHATVLLRGRTTISSMDYREALAETGPADVVYLDPPYQGVTTKRDPRYLEGLSFEAFSDSLRDLNRRGIAYLVSYDGRTGDRHYGQPLPASLELERVEIEAGRSTQATLLGRQSNTYESLYLSPALQERLTSSDTAHKPLTQLELFND